ncbi:Serine/threonine-protein kinase PrkC [Phycisphaerae bacterium RAS1]|nr:Serine/threonine-protein kinase PrkC [Phycisphaerae bacterium RAS1]
MSADRFSRVMELFQQACRLAGEERARFLDQECPNDATLRSEVENLLAHDAKGRGPFRTDAAGGGAALLARALATDAAATDDMPAQIGTYRILRKIGAGGMGAVYEAEQQSPRRTVAIKVIRPELASPALLRRFEQEAQVLGRLQHPGIAQIFEAGAADTPRGPQMFLAMELIRGETLLEHANRATPPLDTRQRLALLARVCDAVQHAHQRGVIHRDLKPSNILVTPEEPLEATGIAETHRAGAASGVDSTLGSRDASLAHVGQPKILDFGVARATDSDLQITTVQTGVGQLVGTLPYMSPEQVSGDPAEIDTRSDVYALGVILYQLLTGKLPHDLSNRSVADAVRVIQAEPPTRLGTFSRLFKGEVETIVFKALEKNKTRRYQSAAELGADLRRYLAGLPIEAKRDSNWYVLQKTLRRYRQLTAAGALLVVLALVSSVWLAILYNRSETNARIARDQSDAARKATDKAVEEADRARQATAQAVAAREQAEHEATKAKQINRVLRRIFQGADPRVSRGKDPTVRELLNNFGGIVLAELESQPDIRAAVVGTLGQTYSSLGDYERALSLLREQYDYHKSVASEETADLLADAASSLASALGALGRWDESEILTREALKIHRKTRGEESQTVAWDIHCLGVVLQYKGDLAAAEPLLRESLAYLRERKPDPGMPLENEQSLLADAIEGLAVLLYQKQKFDEAEPLAREALQIAREKLGEDHPDTAEIWNTVGSIVRIRGDLAQAGECYSNALRIIRKARGDEHIETAAAAANLALVYYNTGKYAEAAELYRQASEIRRVKTPGEIQLAESLSGWGASLSYIGKAAEGEPLLREALDLRHKTLPPGDGRVALTASNLGMCLTALEKYEEAEALLVEAFPILRKTRGDKHRGTRDTLERIIKLYEAWNRPEELEKYKAIRAELDEAK